MSARRVSGPNAERAPCRWTRRGVWAVSAKRLSEAMNRGTGEGLSRHVNGHRIRAACAAQVEGASITEATRGGALHATALGGAMLLVFNPQAYLISALMFSQFLTPGQEGQAALVLWIATIFTLNNLVAFTGWTMLGDMPGQLFRTPAQARRLNAGCALSLVAVAFWMLLRRSCAVGLTGGAGEPMGPLSHVTECRAPVPSLAKGRSSFARAGCRTA